MDVGAGRPVSYLDDAHQVKLAWSDQERGVRRVERLVSLGQATDRRAEVALLEGVQAQARLVEQQDRVLVLADGFGEEDDEERNQPLKPSER